MTSGRLPGLPDRLLEPIAGVDLAAYVLVIRGIATHGYDQTRLAEVADAHGVDPDSWPSAQRGWAERIHRHPRLGEHFARLYSAAAPA